MRGAQGGYDRLCQPARRFSAASSRGALTGEPADHTERLAIVGGGTMGRGLATVAAAHGPVLLCTRTPESADKARDGLDPGVEVTYTREDLGARPPPFGPRVLRAADPREPRSRAPRQSQPDLRPTRAPARPATDPVAMAHPRAHRRRHPIDPHRLQALQDQAVPQAPESDPDRNHDQRHPGLRDR